MSDSDERTQHREPRGVTGTGLVPDTSPVRAEEALDWERLEAWLRARLPQARGALSVTQFPGGHSNLTYCLRFEAPGEPGFELVLRRPPLGPVAPRAHDMAREFAVLSRLSPVFPLAPHAYAFCDDPEVIGAPFYGMERRRGLVVREEWPAALPDDPALRRRVAEGLLDAMVALHDVDFAAAGLGDLGRPEGYVERQVKGWQGRWEKARTREIPALDRLAARLLATLPPSPPPTLVHNDFKLDNVLLDPADPGRVLAILDWEMTTVGDPLIDLGTLLGYWAEPTDPEVRRGSPSSPTTLAGFPTRAQLAERYARARHIDLSAIGWYETFGLFKTAVVLEQIYVRFKRGQTKDPRFARFEQRVPALVQAALEVAERSGIT